MMLQLSFDRFVNEIIILTINFSLLYSNLSSYSQISIYIL